MSDERDLTGADRALIEAIRAEFQPEPLAPGRAAELRRALAEQIERPAPAGRFALPALAGAALAAVALFLALPARTPSPSRAATRAELDAYVDPDAFASELAERDDYLPADYQVLALLVDDAPTDR